MIRRPRRALALSIAVVFAAVFTRTTWGVLPSTEPAAAELPRAPALAECLDRDGLDVEPARMIEACDKALSRGTERPADKTMLLSLRATAHFSLGHFKAAAADGAALLQQNPKNIRARCGHALISQVLGHSSAAKAELKELLKNDPSSLDVQLALGVFAAKEDDAPLCIGATTKAIASAPTCAKAYLLRAAAYYSQNDIRLCHRDIDKALALGVVLDVADPDQLYLFAADVAQRLHRPEEALADLTVAERMKPGTIVARYLAWRIYHSLRRNHMAAYLAAKMVHDFPREVAAHYAVSRTALAVSRYGDATAEAKRALALDPDMAEPLVLLGRIEWGQGHRAAAARWFDKALAKDAEQAGAYFWKALTLVDGDKPSKAQLSDAVRLAETGSGLEGGHYAAGLLLAAYCQARAGDLGKAKKTAQAALLQADDADLRKRIGGLIRDLQQGKVPPKPPSVTFEVEPRVQPVT